MPMMPLSSFALKRTMAIVKMSDQTLIVFQPIRLTPDTQDEVCAAGTRVATAPHRRSMPCATF
eukprot:scaffold43050_cov37-Tisochrysis_lutea.AAC.1